MKDMRLEKINSMKKSGKIASETPKDQIQRKESGRYTADDLPDGHIGKVIIRVVAGKTTRTTYISENQLTLLDTAYDNKGVDVISWSDTYRLTPKTTESYITDSIPSMLAKYNMRVTVGNIIKVLRKWHKPRIKHWNSRGQGEIFGHSGQESDKKVDFTDI